jgi:cytoskeleton protein RodZ
MTEITAMQGHEHTDTSAHADALSPAPGPRKSAGEQLREAREMAGLTIESLSAQLKVSVRNLTSVEAGAWDDLPDFVYTRALIASLCRHLKLNPQEVLQAVPMPPSTNRLLPPPAVDLSASTFRLNWAPGTFKHFKLGLGIVLVLGALAGWAYHTPMVIAPLLGQLQGWGRAIGWQPASANTELLVPATAPETHAPPAVPADSEPSAQGPAAPTPLPAGHVVQDISPGGR